jgi:hypothetical protein
MSDIFNNAGAWVSGLLSPRDSKNVPKELRERIALAMLMQKRAYPKTFGEGLAAIGDAIGDRSVMRQLEAETAASEVKGKEFDDRVSGAPPAAAAAVVPQVQTVQQPLLPARPLPPDEQQSEEPGAPVRMPTAAATQDWRAASPLPRSVVPPPQPPPPTVVQPPQQPPPPPVPPQARSVGDMPAAGPVNRLITPPGPLPPGNIPAPTMQERLAPAFPGQQSALSGAPVMAEGGNAPDPEEMAAARGAIAQAMMQQQAARGGPQPLPTPRAVTPPQPAGGPTEQPAPVIRSAPQPPPVRAMPQQSLVPPLPPEEQPPPTTTPLLQRIAKEIRDATPADRDAIVQRAQPYIQQEQARLSQAHEIWKEKQTLRRQLELEQYKLRAGEPKTQADIDKIQQEIADARKPKVQKLEGDEYERNPQTGVYEPVRTSDAQTGARPKAKLSGEQTKALTFHGWTSLAEEQMQGKEALLSQGIAQELAGKVPFVGNKIQSAEYRRVRGAAERFVQGFLRDISGAVVGPEEIAKHMNSFLPKYGDQPRDIADKRAAREQIINGLYNAAGTGGQKIADFDKNERLQKQAEKISTLNREMEGKDKSKTYEKNGVFRKWVGDHWEEH